MRSAFFGVVAGLALACLLAGCKSTGGDYPDNSTKDEKTEAAAIEAAFYTVNKAIEAGDMETVWKHMSYTQRAVYGTKDKFAIEYHRNKSVWVSMRGTAVIENISVEGNLASAVVTFSGGQKIIVEYAKEESTWREGRSWPCGDGIR
jgi:hypothetical protein